MRRKGMALIGVLAAMILGGTINAYAGSWVQGDAGWKYINEDGSVAMNRWIDGTYYVGADGVMATNTVTPDGYRVGADGAWIQETGALSDSAVEALYLEKIEEYKQTNSRGEYKLDYLIEDFNQDGVKDLLILHSLYVSGYDYFSKIELHSVQNGNVVLCDTVENKGLPGYIGGAFAYRKAGQVLVHFAESKNQEYIYSIAPSLKFFLEAYYSTHPASGVYGQIGENGNHIFANTKYAIDIEDHDYYENRIAMIQAAGYR